MLVRPALTRAACRFQKACLHHAHICPHGVLDTSCKVACWELRGAEEKAEAYLLGWQRQGVESLAARGCHCCAGGRRRRRGPKHSTSAHSETP